MLLLLAFCTREHRLSAFLSDCVPTGSLLKMLTLWMAQASRCFSTPAGSDLEGISDRLVATKSRCEDMHGDPFYDAPPRHESTTVPPVRPRW